MSDLENFVREWRIKMLAAGIESPVPLDELEIHLREEIEQQMKSGMNEPEAFITAVQQIGQVKTLQSEFAKVYRTKAIALLGLKCFLIIIFSTALVALNIYLASELKTICLFDLGLLSFVLPFMASSQTPKSAADSKRWSRIVWTGQLLMGFCGVLINFSSHPVFGLMAAISICIPFALALRQQTCTTVARS
jgi:hypothetical protein